MVYYVSCEHDGIAVLAVDDVHDGAQVLFVAVFHGADMEVGEVGYAVSVEVGWQVGVVESVAVYDVVVPSVEVAEEEEADGEYGCCHGEDAYEADEQSFVVLVCLGSVCDCPVDEMPHTVYSGKESLWHCDGEEDEHEDADPWLVLWHHVVAADDDGCCCGEGGGWYEPREPQPQARCPALYIHYIYICVGERKEKDDEQ